MQAGVKMIEGRGKIVDPHTVCVKDKKYTVSHPFLQHIGRNLFIHVLQAANHCYTSID